MSLLQKIFGKKSNNTQFAVSNNTLAKISEVLTDVQKDRAFSFYNKHKQHIDKIVSDTEKAYEPSETEDKNNPMIWKAEYWKWFFAMRP